MKELQVGQKAPDFTLPSSDGGLLKLSNLKDQKIILYFYPKDMTPGCTTEANDFTNLLKQFQKNNTIILGISPDNIDRHLKFIEKEKIKFLLLADEQKKVSEKYGVWKEKSMYGKKYMGVERSTFIINEKGIIDKIYRKVSVKNHAKEVYSTI